MNWEGGAISHPNQALINVTAATDFADLVRHSTRDYALSLLHLQRLCSSEAQEQSAAQYNVPLAMSLLDLPDELVVAVVDRLSPCTHFPFALAC